MSRHVVVRLIEDKPKTREEFNEAHPGMDVDDFNTAYRQYLDHFQPWRWIAASAGNHERLAKSTESYFNRVDCERAIELLFSISTRVELVRIVDGIEARSPLR